MGGEKKAAQKQKKKKKRRYEDGGFMLNGLDSGMRCLDELLPYAPLNDRNFAEAIVECQDTENHASRPD